MIVLAISKAFDSIRNFQGAQHIRPMLTVIRHTKYETMGANQNLALKESMSHQFR
jgi:hypothetical protein